MLKTKPSKKQIILNQNIFLITIAISGIVGAIDGILANTKSQVLFLAGYAGIDFIENLYKTKLDQKL